MTALPEGTHLAYTLYHETEWWPQLPQGSRPNGGRPTVQVAASAKGAGGGVAWEFAISKYDFRTSGEVLRIDMFNDSWQAFTQLPEFFTALASGEVTSLADVVDLLNRLGAVDETERPVRQ